MFELSADSILNIKTAEEFSAFLMVLSDDFKRHADEWENVTLSDYFEAISAWISCANSNEEDKSIPWGLMAKTMYMGKIYE
mgnify:FL=1